jgi:hypothetical protein
MRKSTRFISGLAMAGIVAAGGSAFTAQSNFKHEDHYVGAASQRISGVHVNNVQYTFTAATDTTTAVAFNIDENLADGETVTATISDGTPAHDLTIPCTAPDGSEDGTNLVCNFGDGLAGVTQLSIVAS